MLEVCLAILLPFIFALLTPFVEKILGKRIGLWAILGSTLSLACILSLSSHASTDAPLYAVQPWVPALGLTVGFYVDGLSWFFAFLISGMGILINIYSCWYLYKTDPPGRFFAYMLFFMGSMLGLVLVSNLILLIIFWELTTISSFLLIGYRHNTERARYGAVKSILITASTGLAMLAGIMLLAVVFGTAEIPLLIEKADLIHNHALYLPILILLLVGAFGKSAQSPFHLWLPDAMEAPTPVSAYLHSATMVKAGVFLIARLYPVFSGREEWILFVASIGTITMILGGYWALRKTDLKAILAYSTVSQLGLMIMGLGLASLTSIKGAALHIINHAAFKAALFLVAGIIDHETGTRDIRFLSGLRRTMPKTAILAGIACLASAGIPFFNGFVSKELLFEASFEQSSLASWMVVFPVLAVIGSVFTFTYSLKIFFGVFFGPDSKGLPRYPHDPASGMLFSPALLTAICIVFGVAPFLAESLVANITGAILQIPVELYLTLWHGITPALIMSLIAFLGGTLLFLQKKHLELLHSAPAFGLRVNVIYDWSYERLLAGSERIINIFQNRKARFYFMYLLGTAVFLPTLFFLRLGNINFLSPNLFKAEPYEYAAAAAFILATLGVAIFQSRLARIICLGGVGYLLCALFIVLRAPDLSLTQLLVDSVTVILFILVIYFLPTLKKESEPLVVKIRDIVISALTGTFIGLFMLAVYSHRQADTIARYFLESSYELAGGKNVVNVILINFRAFDTLGEIIVLAISGIGIYALIRLGLKKKKRMNHD